MHDRGGVAVREVVLLAQPLHAVIEPQAAWTVLEMAEPLMKRTPGRCRGSARPASDGFLRSGEGPWFPPGSRVQPVTTEPASSGVARQAFPARLVGLAAMDAVGARRPILSSGRLTGLARRRRPPGIACRRRRRSRTQRRRGRDVSAGSAGDLGAGVLGRLSRRLGQGVDTLATLGSGSSTSAGSTPTTSATEGSIAAGAGFGNRQGLGGSRPARTCPQGARRTPVRGSSRATPIARLPRPRRSSGRRRAGGSRCAPPGGAGAAIGWIVPRSGQVPTTTWVRALAQRLDGVVQMAHRRGGQHPVGHVVAADDDRRRRRAARPVRGDLAGQVARLRADEATSLR